MYVNGVICVNFSKEVGGNFFLGFFLIAYSLLCFISLKNKL